MQDKLESIRVETVMYDQLPLSEVVRNLAEESKRRDPEKKGVNFVITQPSPVAVGGLDPVTGMPIPKEAVDIDSVAIKIVPPLNNVRMSDVLDAVVKVANHPIKYSIADYGVIFSLKDSDDSVRPPTTGRSGPPRAR